MASYRCESCGKSFDPNKSEICPSCGSAVPPKVLIRIQRRQGVAGFLREERENHDPKCHEDDAWTGSYGEQLYHQRSSGHSHAAGSRVASANPFKLQYSSSHTQTRANQHARSGKPRKKSGLYFLCMVIAIISILIILFTVFRLFGEIRDFSGGDIWGYFDI